MSSTTCSELATLESPEPSSPREPETGSSYGQILKSSAMIGGSQALNVAIGIVRTKAMAIFLGPSGFGLVGLYNSIIDLGQSIAGLGVNSSGVRQIAEAVASDDVERIGLTVVVLRRTSVVLGMVGSVLLVLFARQVSSITFGSYAYTTSIRILSLAVFCKLVSGGQAALIQGMRRISDLAKMNILGAIFGAVSGVILVYVYRDKGIVPYLIAITAMTIATSWWYSRKIKVPIPKLRLSEVRQETAALLRLGVAFMVSALITLGVAYVTRILVLHRVGLTATGYYQSAWTLGALYVSFILQAMGADFYPRLTGSINDPLASNRLVNEQARVGLLLAGPGVIATITFAPAVIVLLYSAKFFGSVPVLRWICLGSALQVITWPLGFVIVAKGLQNLFLASEIAWAVASLALAWSCIAYFGVVGAGIAFFLSYIFHGVVTYAIARRLTGFTWSKETKRTAYIFASLIALSFAICYALPIWLTAVIGFTITVVSAVYSYRTLIRAMGTGSTLPRILTMFRRASA